MCVLKIHFSVLCFLGNVCIYLFLYIYLCTYKNDKVSLDIVVRFIFPRHTGIHNGDNITLSHTVVHEDHRNIYCSSNAASVGWKDPCVWSIIFFNLLD